MCLVGCPDQWNSFFIQNIVIKWLEKLLKLRDLLMKYFALFCPLTCPCRSSHDAVCLRFARKFLHNWLQFPSFRSFLFTKTHSDRVHGNFNKLHVSQQSRETAGPLLNWHLLIAFVRLLWLMIGREFSSTMRRVTRIMDARMFSLGKGLLNLGFWNPFQLAAYP